MSIAFVLLFFVSPFFCVDIDEEICQGISEENGFNVISFDSHSRLCKSTIYKHQEIILVTQEIFCMVESENGNDKTVDFYLEGDRAIIYCGDGVGVSSLCQGGVFVSDKECVKSMKTDSEVNVISLEVGVSDEMDTGTFGSILMFCVLTISALVILILTLLRIKNVRYYKVGHYRALSSGENRSFIEEKNKKSMGDMLLRPEKSRSANRKDLIEQPKTPSSNLSLLPLEDQHDKSESNGESCDEYQKEITMRIYQGPIIRESYVKADRDVESKKEKKNLTEQPKTPSSSLSIPEDQHDQNVETINDSQSEISMAIPQKPVVSERNVTSERDLREESKSTHGTEWPKKRTLILNDKMEFVESDLEPSDSFQSQEEKDEKLRKDKELKVKKANDLHEMFRLAKFFEETFRNPKPNNIEKTKQKSVSADSNTPKSKDDSGPEDKNTWYY